jgi:hypothetical protein
LRVKPALELAERVGDTVLDSAVVDRNTAARLCEFVLDTLEQLGQLRCTVGRSSSVQRSS